MEVKKFEFLKLSEDAESNSRNQSQHSQAPVEGKTFRYFAGSLIEVEEKEFTKRELEQAQESSKKQSFDEGFKKAEAEVTEKTLKLEEQNAAAISGLTQTLSSIETQLEAEKTKFKQEVLTLARQSVTAIFGNIFDEKAADIFADAIDEAYPVYERKGKIIIKAEPQIIEKLQQKVTKALEGKENQPEIIFEPDPDAANMCRLEWGNSGINIDLNEKLKQVENIFDEYLKSVG